MHNYTTLDRIGCKNFWLFTINKIFCQNDENNQNFPLNNGIIKEVFDSDSNWYPGESAKETIGNE
jgi:hypothetical protein